MHDLKTLPAPQRLAAISAAMPVAGEGERAMLAGALVRMALPASRLRLGGWLGNRWIGWVLGPGLEAVLAQHRVQSDAACIEVARCWLWLPELARAAALEACRGRWGPPVRAAVADPSAEVRVGAAELVIAVGEAALLGEVGGLLGDPSGDVVMATERAYVLAASAAEAGSGERVEVERQVAAALGGYDRHRSRAVLATAVSLADTAFLVRMRAKDGGPLAVLLLDEAQPFQMALRSFLRRSGDAGVRARAWAWMGHGIGAGAAVERVSRAESPQEHEAVLRRIHLVENPRRAAKASRIKVTPGTTGSIVPDEAMLDHLSAAAKKAVPRWLEAIGMSAGARQAAALPLLQDRDPGVRWAALRSVSGAGLIQACADADARVAASALRRTSAVGLERRRASGRPLHREEDLEALRRHPSSTVRLLADQEAERQDPWDARSPLGRLAARMRVAASPDIFFGELRDRLRAGEDRVGAVLVIRALGLHARFEADLLALVRSAPLEAEDDRLTPTVLAALGELATEGARCAVDAHVRDVRPRLRANAVEALARQARAAAAGDRRADVLIEFKDDPNHRVRANAIRGLFHRGRLFGEPAPRVEEPVAFDSLGTMLSDARPSHRIAAIWLAARVLGPSRVVGRRWTELAGRVSDLSRTDPDPTARARAVGAAARLTIGMRDGWKVSAADVGAYGAETARSVA